MQVNAGKVLKIVLKVLLYTLSSFALVLFIVLLLLRTEKVQNIIRQEAVSYLSKKLGTNVAIGRFRTDLLSNIEIQGIRVEDQSKDVLLNVGKLEINYRLIALLNNSVSIQQVSIDTLFFRMERNETDTAFNFDFIIRAFSSPSSTDSKEDTTTSPMKFDIGKLTIKQLHYIMDDRRGQQFYDARSGLIAVYVDKLDIKNQDYHIKSLEAKGLTAIIDSDSSPPDTTQSESSGLLPRIIIDQVSLLDNSFSVQLPGSGYQSETDIRNFHAENFNLDLNTNKLSLHQVLLAQHESKVLIKSVKTELPVEKNIESAASDSEPFTVAIGSIRLQENDLKYDQENVVAKVSTDFNQDHIHLKELQLLIEDFTFEGSTIQGYIQHFQAKEQCGLDIQQLSTRFVYSDTGVI